MDIVFLLDGSGSIGSNFKNIKQWTNQLALKLYRIDKKIRIGVIQFSHYQKGRR